METESDAPDGTRWCAGLPLTRQAALTDAQRTLARAVYERARNATLGFTLLGVAVFPSALITAVAYGQRLGERSYWLLAALFLVFFFAIPVCMAKAIDAGRAAFPLRDDLALGELLIFEGTIAKARYEEEDPELAALAAEGALAAGDTRQAIGVLPSSQRLLHVNGRDVEPKRKLHIAVTASSPPRSLRYSLPPDVKQAFGTTQGLKRRRFGDAERQELSAHIAQLTSVPWILFVLTAFMAVTVSTWVLKGIDNVRELLGIGWLVAWVLTAFRHVRRYLLARRFEDDLEVGWLLSWETPDVPVLPGSRAASERPPFKTAEVLPISQMDWMIDGKPAAWRRVIQRS